MHPNPPEPSTAPAEPHVAEAEAETETLVLTGAELAACIGASPTGVAITAIPSFLVLPHGEAFRQAAGHGLASLFARGHVRVGDESTSLLGLVAATAVVLTRATIAARVIIDRPEGATALVVIGGDEAAVLARPLPLGAWAVTPIERQRASAERLALEQVELGFGAADARFVSLEVAAADDAHVELLVAERRGPARMHLRHGAWTPQPDGTASVTVDEALGEDDDATALARLAELLDLDD